jgi:hypothetical protein
MNTDVYQIMEQKLYQTQLSKNLQLNDFQKEITHIHNKSIFDALNESLDLNRIYGLKGKPFPWVIQATRLK